MPNNQMLNDLRIFVYIVRQGSLIKAADVLGIPLPTISRRLMFLEESTGKKLMFRDNRSIKLTTYGELFYNTCSELIIRLDDEIAKMMSYGGSMSGVIKLCAPRSLYYHYIHEELIAFETENQDITFNITLPSMLTPDALIKNDIIITKDTDGFSDLTRKIFCESRFVVCAAPGYVKASLQSLDELISGNIKFVTVSSFEKWKFVNKKSIKDRSIIEPTPYIHTEEFNLARYFVISGKGLSLFPYAFVAEDISNGKLVVVNTGDWVPENVIHYILYAHYKDIPLKTKELVKFLTRKGVVHLK